MPNHPESREVFTVMRNTALEVVLLFLAVSVVT